MVLDAHVADPNSHKITITQLAVDREIEKSEITSALFELQLDPDCPDLLRFQSAFLANEPAVFQRVFAKPTGAGIALRIVASLIPTVLPQLKPYLALIGFAESTITSGDPRRNN